MWRRTCALVVLQGSQVMDEELNGGRGSKGRVVAAVSASFHPRGLDTAYRSVFEQDTEPGTCQWLVQLKGLFSSV